ncbi:hypothetical protein [Xanthomonas floridensis]|uniref:hypothetical protein n=1 Tax=Xanthomonas floridensis TaxID=1843580 RepID=UPI002B1E9750|nr:hypothetical protein [Xanthomonas floridensis]
MKIEIKGVTAQQPANVVPTLLPLGTLSAFKGEKVPRSGGPGYARSLMWLERCNAVA